jgi:hypothetical protein
MHEHEMDNDPNLLLIMMPLFEILNHRPSPNVAIHPTIDKVEEKSFLLLKALQDIEPGE